MVDTPSAPRERLIDLYRQLYELTEPECRNSCRCPLSCCSPEYCEMAIEWGRDQWGTTLEPTGHERLPLMGSEGCIAAPHLRPLCTRHTCDVSSLGMKYHPAPDEEWTRRYFDIREQLDELEFELFPTPSF